MKSFLLCRSAGDVEGGREVLRSALRHLPGNAILWQVMKGPKNMRVWDVLWARTLGRDDVHEFARPRKS